MIQKFNPKRQKIAATFCVGFGMLLLFFLMLISSCKKEENPIDPIPQIELLEIGPETVREFQDSLVIQLKYTDGDGDLGGIHPDSSNLFVIDKRIDVPFEFRIQELVPGGEEVPITGIINIVIQNLFLTGSGSSEAATFEIYAEDRAGHRSNTVETGVITVVE